MQRFQSKHYIIFSLQSNMAAKPCDLFIIRKHTNIPLPCRICVWNFPLIWPAVLEMFEGFWLNSIWLPNHATNQLEINKLVKGCLGEYVRKVSPQSVQPFWRIRFIYLFFKTIWLPNCMTCDVKIFISCRVVPLMTLKKFQIYPMHRSAFWNFTRIPLHQWCHKKITLLPHG